MVRLRLGGRLRDLEDDRLVRGAIDVVDMYTYCVVDEVISWPMSMDEVPNLLVDVP